MTPAEKAARERENEAARERQEEFRRQMAEQEKKYGAMADVAGKPRGPADGHVTVYDRDGGTLRVHAVDATELCASGRYSLTALEPADTEPETAPAAPATEAATEATSKGVKKGKH